MNIRLASTIGTLTLAGYLVGHISYGWMTAIVWDCYGAGGPYAGWQICQPAIGQIIDLITIIVFVLLLLFYRLLKPIGRRNIWIASVVIYSACLIAFYALFWQLPYFQTTALI